VQPTVLKFGGTSVEDAAAFQRVAGIVSQRQALASTVVVVSAMSGVTDALMTATRDADRRRGLGADLERHVERHRTVAVQLLGSKAASVFESLLEDGRLQLAALLEQARVSSGDKTWLGEEIVSWGERLSAPLLAACLAESGLDAVTIDARSCIVADDVRETTRRTHETLAPLLAQDVTPVLGGFIASTPCGRTTTLGRGGSDYSAALVASAVGAEELQIWTDVPGVLTADPRVVPQARTIPRLSYAEAAELAYFGAKVLHPRTMQPAMVRGIPIRVCNSRAPDAPATLVAAHAVASPGTVKAIAHKTGITVVQVTSGRMLGAHGFLRALFEVFERHRTVVDLVATSEVSVSLTVDVTTHLLEIISDLESLGDVSVEHDRAIVCVVGEGVRTTPGIAARVFDTLRDINVLLISQGASQVNLSFVVAQSAITQTVGNLHHALLEPAESSEVIGDAPDALPGDVANLTACLVNIPSVSGDEANVARYLSRCLRSGGWNVDLCDALPQRPNLFATTGTGAARVVFCTHLDTVAPFVPASVADGYVAGRGACDAKGIIAAQIVAAERLRAEGISDIGLLFVVDEEVGSLGARAANDLAQARDCRYLIVGEPTENQLALGCKGSLRVLLETTGSGGHSALPARGQSAIHGLIALLADLQACDWPGDAFFGPTTLNVGTVSGGIASNIVAPAARAELHFRLATDARAIESLFTAAVRGRATIQRLSETPPVRLAAVPGFETSVASFTTDAAHLSNWGTALLLGPGSIADAHRQDERVSIAELERGVDAYVRLARRLLQERIA
jgi:aspartate kinase